MMLKKYTDFILVIFTFICLSCSSVFSEENQQYLKFMTIKEPKTNIEFGRTIIPDNFVLDYKIKWDRDLQEPAHLYLKSVSQDDNETYFLYVSPQSFSSTDKTVSEKAKRTDNILQVTRKDFSAPKEYVLQYIKSTYPDAENIELITDGNCADDIKEFLIGEMYQKAENLKSDIKMEKKTTSAKVNNPYAEPYYAIYKYDINGIIYKQIFMTMFTSVDYELTKKTSYGLFETTVRKLWTIKGFYTYRTQEENFDKNYDNFIVFMTNSIINNKAANALSDVKKQLIIESNPNYRDINTRSPLKNMSSDLFRKYYEGGAPNYAEDKNNPLFKPSVEQSAWFASALSPLNVYWFVHVKNLWNQKCYVPDNYNNVYYNSVRQKFFITKDDSKPNGAWIKMKKAKTQYKIK